MRAWILLGSLTAAMGAAACGTQAASPFTATDATGQTLVRCEPGQHAVVNTPAAAAGRTVTAVECVSDFSARGRSDRIGLGIRQRSTQLTRNGFGQRHSAIRYVTPNERHHGHETAVLASRYNLYEQMRRANPERWSGRTRNWLPVEAVVLNPERALLARQLS